MFRENLDIRGEIDSQRKLVFSLQLTEIFTVRLMGILGRSARNGSSSYDHHIIAGDKSSLCATRTTPTVKMIA